MVDATEIKRRIFGALSAAGDLTVSQLSSMLRVREHVVRYQLNQLVRSETIQRTVLVNQRALGMLVYTIFFDVPPLSYDSVVAFFKKRQEVWWFAMFHGPHTFELSLVAPDPSIIEKLFYALGEATGVHLRNRRVALSEDRYEWGMRFLSSEYHSRTPRRLRRESAYEPDDVDLRILRELHSESYATSLGLARSLGLAPTSLAYRLARLRDAHVISDDIYEVRRDSEYVNVVLLVTMKVLSVKSQRQLLEFCQTQPHVKGLSVDVGGWDYRVSLYGDCVQDLLRTADVLSAKLSQVVESVSVLVRREILRLAAGV